MSSWGSMGRICTKIIHGLYRGGETQGTNFLVASAPRRQTPPIFTLNFETGFVQFKESGPFKMTEKTSVTMCKVMTLRLVLISTRLLQCFCQILVFCLGHFLFKSLISIMLFEQSPKSLQEQQSLEIQRRERLNARLYLSVFTGDIQYLECLFMDTKIKHLYVHISI